MGTVYVKEGVCTMATGSHTLFLTVVIGLAVLSTGTRSEAAPAPCALVTAAEVEQVVGKLAGAPKGDQEGSAAWCNYEFVNGTDAMEVWVFPADGIERGRAKAKNPVAVKGLGEDAFLTRGMHGLDYVDLFIKKGKATIKLSLKETAGDEDKLKTLGQKAAGRM
jgi:hypothetical protein